MSITNSSFLGMVVAILEATTFDHCSVCDTNASYNNTIVTSLESASFTCHLSSMRDTNSSLLCTLGASLVAASFNFCAMCDANSSCIGSIGTPVEEAASFPRCAMRDTNASFLDKVGTPIVAASTFLY